jgi:hypothetical protein
MFVPRSEISDLARGLFLHPINQEKESADSQNARNYSDHRYGIHSSPQLIDLTAKLLSQKMCQKVGHGNDGGANYDHSHARENEEHEGRNKFDGGFGSHFLGPLPSLRAKGIGKYA